FLVILRASVVCMAVLASWLALYRTNIFELVSESSILGLVTLFVPMVTALFWKKSSQGGAVLSMVVGLICWFLSEHVFHFEFPAMFIGFGASALGMVMGTFMFPKRPDILG
ncbi:MAG: sodium:solute symporter, partial [Imperialibacter sp.]